MIKQFTAREVVEFEVLPPLYLPFFNKWGANAYSTYQPFDHDPFTIRATSTSGSPVMLCGDKFFGFMNESGGRFAYDGCGRLKITGEPGQVLWYSECCNPFAEWQAYNNAVLADQPAYKPEPFWSGLEYCTWVDQKNAAASAGVDVHAPLTETYVYDYMKRVKALGLPPGKLTIDDGWDVRQTAAGKCYGNWEIDREKFPNMERLVQDMRSEGFLPGLWFAPFTFTPNCELGRAHPELIGEPWSQTAELDDAQRLMFIRPSAVLEEYYRRIFAYYIDMGFAKFKLDMSYGRKDEMKALLSMIYRVIKSIDKTVEVEAHIPDIFVSRYCDTVRINDVSFDAEGKWREVTMEHYKVCRYSAHDRILNLDHIGTNTPTPTAEQYLEHTKLLLRLTGGYPCVSLLPDRISADAADQYVGMVCEWCAQTKDWRSHQRIS